MKKPIVVGITGGIASGKSEVTRILESQGAVVVQADKIGHQVLEDPDVRTLLIRQFGKSIISQETNGIDRKRLADWVFGDSPPSLSRRRALEAITHPPIRAQIHNKLNDLLNTSTATCIVLDIPLLLESGWEQSCDAVWFVDAPDELRKKRALVRGWDEDHFRSREASQWPVEAKKAKASRIISNRGSLEDLKRQVIESLLDECTKSNECWHSAT
jgi:dephospho-CoA kinase